MVIKDPSCASGSARITADRAVPALHCDVFPCVGVEVQVSICLNLNDEARQLVHRHVG
ncbi:hypothetical protein SynNOUM97013_01721 [Synechococcus sp. NOUM97013]|nr:hypothetical protein SynNOUM97013_01721 [Synechococcus sp. NOUM97013]